MTRAVVLEAVAAAIVVAIILVVAWAVGFSP